MPDTKTLLEQFDAALAAGAVTAERGASYGDPADAFSRAARIRAVVASCPDEPIGQALAMIGVKMARLAHCPDHLDSWIDIAGYARCAVMILDKREASTIDRAR